MQSWSSSSSSEVTRPAWRGQVEADSSLALACTRRSTRRGSSGAWARQSHVLPLKIWTRCKRGREGQRRRQTDALGCRLRVGINVGSACRCTGGPGAVGSYSDHRHAAMREREVERAISGKTNRGRESNQPTRPASSVLSHTRASYRRGR